MRNPDDPTASTDAGDGAAGERSFYGRWSRRKRQARDGVALPDEPTPRVAEAADRGAATVVPPAAQEAGDSPSPVDERVLTDADMPPLESLGEKDDYSGFMSPGVSEALRNQALRQLFRSSQFNVVDGLDDYADDFTSFEPLGDIITADMRHQVEMQAERAKREAEEKARALLAEEQAGADTAAGEGREVADAEGDEAATDGQTQARGADEPASPDSDGDARQDVAGDDPGGQARDV